MQETWYVLEDGSVADPAHVSHDGIGLRHRDGRLVKMRFADVPCTRSVTPEEERAKVAAKAMEPQPKRPYNTRVMKAGT